MFIVACTSHQLVNEIKSIAFECYFIINWWRRQVNCEASSNHYIERLSWLLGYGEQRTIIWCSKEREIATMDHLSSFSFIVESDGKLQITKHLLSHARLIESHSSSMRCWSFQLRMRLYKYHLWWKCEWICTWNSSKQQRKTRLEQTKVVFSWFLFHHDELLIVDFFNRNEDAASVLSPWVLCSLTRDCEVL